MLVERYCVLEINRLGIVSRLCYLVDVWTKPQFSHLYGGNNIYSQYCWKFQYLILWLPYHNFHFHLLIAVRASQSDFQKKRKYDAVIKMIDSDCNRLPQCEVGLYHLLAVFNFFMPVSFPKNGDNNRMPLVGLLLGSWKLY